MEAVTTELPKRRRVLRDDVPLTPAQIELRERMEAEVARRKAGRQARQEPTRDESAPTRQSVPPRSYTSSSLLKPPTHSRTRSRNRVLKGMTVSALAVLGGVNSQLKSHFAICLNIGILPEQLSEFITILEQHCGAGIGENARRVLDECQA